MKQLSAVNTLIRVNRDVKPTSYPRWLKQVMHPELENQGPVEYDLSKVELWTHERQGSVKWISGSEIYAHLKENDNELLKSCLTLRDGEEIIRNGAQAFLESFPKKALFLWGSVVEETGGNLCVPCLCVGETPVVIAWVKLSARFRSDSPAGRHAS